MYKIARALTCSCIYLLGFGTHPLPLVYDTHADLSTDVLSPKRFRTMQSPYKNPSTASRTGLEKMQASGSGQFSVPQLHTIITTAHPYHVIILDFREEYHGFMNAEAISWYLLPHNQSNKGYALDDIIKHEQEALTQLRTNAPVIYLIHKKIPPEGGTTTIRTLVNPQCPITCVLKTEALIAHEHTIGYIRLPVTDRMMPTDINIDRFVDIVTTKGPKEWLHLHCRGGLGRTTTFLILYDMLLNASDVSCEDILARQAALDGKNFLFKPQEKAFFEKFYAYAQARHQGSTDTWSSWHKQK